MNGNNVIFRFLYQADGLRYGAVFRAHQGHEKFLARMQETKYSRKLENNGRLLIPIRLREEMGLIPGKVYHFFTHEENNRKFICIDCGIPETKPVLTIEEAVRIIQENGMKIVQNDD